MRCTLCRGHGKIIPPEKTRTDAVECPRCRGSGDLPNGYKLSNKKRHNQRYRNITRTAGIEDLKWIEGV